MTTNTEALTEQERKALKLISESQISVASITVRELGEALGYASPRQPQEIIVALEKAGFIKRTKRGQIQVL